VARRGGAGLFGPERAGIARDKFIGKSAGTNRSEAAPRRGAANALRNHALTGPIRNLVSTDFQNSGTVGKEEKDYENTSHRFRGQGTRVGLED